jgi:imidazolonepropionase-like amidohydrolase
LEKHATLTRGWVAAGLFAVALPCIAIALNGRSRPNERVDLDPHTGAAGEYGSSAALLAKENTRESASASMNAERSARDASSSAAWPESGARDSESATARAEGSARDSIAPSSRAGESAPARPSRFVAELMSQGALGAGAQDARSRTSRGKLGSGERGSTNGLALLAKKAVVVGPEGREVVDNALVLVKDGKIESLGPARTTPVPAGYEVVDCGDKWLVPGFIDLHCHIAGKSFLINDINDMVYMTNPELRASSVVQPGNPNLLRGVAGGVTSVLFIPGSGTNMGGQGVLLKTGLDTYEEMQIRNPGSLKLAQAGNPERWAIGVGRSLMNWNTRSTFRRGLAYAQQWKEFEDGKGPKPERNIQWDVFRELLAKRTQVSTHTQMYQVVEMTLTMVRQEFGLDVYIDHGEFAGMRSAKQAQDLGVSAIVGPRELDGTIWQLSPGSDGKFIGIAAGYQEAGHKMIGFNTDSPIVAEEELPVQATMSVHYGFDNSKMDAVRGLTIVPAMTAGIDKRVGSLAPGKDADILVVTGDPIDPRNTVETVFIEGRRVYDIGREKRRW